MIKSIKLLALCVFFCEFTVLADNHLTHRDSVFQCLNQTNDVIETVDCLLELSAYYINDNPDSSLVYAHQAEKYSEENYYFEGAANAYGWLGFLYHRKGNIKLSGDYYLNSLRMMRHLDKKEGEGIILNNLGFMYQEIGDIKLSQRYLNEALRIHSERDDSVHIAITLNNIGINYENLGDTANALNHYIESYQIDSIIENKTGMATSLNNIGHVKLKQGKHSEALLYFNTCLFLGRETNDLATICTNHFNIGKIAYLEQDYRTAELHLTKSLEIAEHLGYPYDIEVTSGLLHKLYYKQKKFRLAYDMYDVHVDMKDSLKNLDNEEALMKVNLENEYEKKELKAKLKYEEQRKIENIEHEKQIQRQRIFTYFGSGLALLAIVIAFLIYRGYRERKKSNDRLLKLNRVIELQKIQVEDKNKEIQDSIAYAKRIQQAILPSKDELDSTLRDYFAFYKPKDIVSGDFYWVHSLSEHECLFAVADCTGHGVPGAFVSIVCNNALNISVKEFKLTEPSKILNKSRELILEEFGKSGESKKNKTLVNDGMDISICKLNFKDLTLSFSGANNSVYIIRNKELTELKGDRQPVGEYISKLDFKESKLKLKPHDMVYLYTDGYPDQFGGEVGKKYKYKNFKKLLILLSSLSCNIQHTELGNELDRFMGSYEQIDDISVIGIRI